MTENVELKSLMDVSEGRLWERIGEAALEGPEAAYYASVVNGLGARQTRAERARAAGEAWFARHRKALHDAICGNERLRTVFSSNPGASVEIARAVADAIIALQLLVPVPTIAMLIARKGLDWICAEDA